MLARTWYINEYTNAESFILTAYYTLYLNGLQDLLKFNIYFLAQLSETLKAMVNQDLFRILENFQ